MNQHVDQCANQHLRTYYLEDTLRAVLTAVRAQASQGWVELQERRNSAVLHGSAGGGVDGSSGVKRLKGEQRAVRRYSSVVVLLY